MIQINLKAANLKALQAFSTGDRATNIEGTKLNALYNLIQKCGETVTTEGGKLSGIKALHLSGGSYIAIKRVGNASKFYPCSMQVFNLQTI